MPMKADEAITALTVTPGVRLGLRETMGYLAAQRAIREAFAVRDRARAELERLEEYQRDYGIEISAQSPINAKVRLLRRIIGEGSQ